MSAGTILSSREADTCYIRLVGRLTFAASRCFDTFIEQLFDEPTQNVVIDLNDADYLDSTMLGLLAKIARRLQADRQRRPTILSGREDIDILLDSVCFDAAFDIVHGRRLDGMSFTEIPALAGGAPATDTLFEAHQLLMDLSERNRDAFHDTVATLKRSIGRGVE